MKRVILTKMVAACALLTMSAQLCQAVLTLSLSSPEDLTNLSVGQSVTIDVGLTGDPNDLGDGLVTLTGSVFFPDSTFRFGIPPIIDKGLILPDPFDFFEVPGPGEANGSYVTFVAPNRVTMFGSFFSFQVHAQQPGSGVFTFRNPDPNVVDPFSALIAEEFDPQDPNIDNPILRDLQGGPDLPFRIQRKPIVRVIPEPLTATLGAVGLMGVALAVRRRPMP